ncbi:MAG: AAA family ATPase [Candidatus Moraniibacteriota bacterium]
MAHRALSILIHSDTKVGKSTFGNTAPAPRLILDAEAAYRFLPGTKVFWDPMTQAPPEYDGAWETCVAIIRTYGHLIRAYEWLNSGRHPFVSVVIDSISEVQTKCKDDLANDGRMTIQLWGDLLSQMEKLIRGFRDLTEHPVRPLQAVVITSMTQMRDGKYRPYVQGQLQVKMPYFLDVIGYMYVDTVPNIDPTQPPHKMRRLLVVPHVQFEAGERVQGRLGEIVDNPTVPLMLDMVFGSETKEN